MSGDAPACGTFSGLRHICASAEGISVDSEQLRSDVFGEVVGSPVCAAAVQCKTVFAGSNAETSLNPVGLFSVQEFQTPAEDAALPRRIQLTVIIGSLVTFLFGESVEHGGDEFRQCSFSESVGFVDDGHMLPEIQRVVMETAEVFDMTAKQSHNVISSPPSA